MATKKGGSTGKRAEPPTTHGNPHTDNGNTGVYTYTDESSNPLFRVVKRPDKRFHQERYLNGSWLSGLGNTPRVLYHLPEVLETADRGGTVWITEGEKDADAIRAQSIPATTNPGGAGKNKWHDEYGKALIGVRRAVIVYDNDDEGRKHALNVEASLKAVGVPVRFRRALEGNDTSDHLAAGLPLHELVEERPGPPLAPGSAVAAERPADGSEGPLPAPLQLAHDRLAAHALTNGLPAPRPWSEGVGWEACCPAHDDRNASLSLGRGDSRPVVAWCHVGCELPEIAAGLRMDARDFSRAGFEQSSSSSNSWAPVDLEEIVAGVQSGEIVGPVPTLLPRTDGKCLLYPGEVHSLSGEPETGKGWVALFAAVSVIKQGGDVWYGDFEDHAASIVVRLFALGLSAEEIVEHFTYVRPVDPFSDDALRAMLDARTYALAVIDGVTEAYHLLGLNPASNDDAPKFLARLPRPIADRGAAVLEIDHVVKDREQQGRWSIGAQHKLAGIGVAYTTRVLKALSRQDGGRVKLTVAKDRHGQVGSRGDIAVVYITPTDGGRQVSVRMEPPDGRDSGGKVVRPTELMERTSKVIEETPGLSKTQVLHCVRGHNPAIDRALKLLIAEKYVAVAAKGRQQLLHSSIKPFRQ